MRSIILYRITNDRKRNLLWKNDPTIDLGIAIDQAYQETLDNGIKCLKDDFIRTVPKSLLRSFLKNGGDVKENSYAQLIDDYVNDIEVKTIDGEKEFLSSYILRNALEGVE